MAKRRKKDDIEGPLDDLARALDDALTFCGQCGRKVDPVEETCPDCGAALREGAGTRESEVSTEGAETRGADVIPEVPEADDRTEVELDSLIREVSKDLDLEPIGREPDVAWTASRNARGSSKATAVAPALTLVGVLVYVTALVAILPALGNEYAALTIIAASILIVYGGLVHRTRTARAPAENVARSPSVGGGSTKGAVPGRAPRLSQSREGRGASLEPEVVPRPEREPGPAAARCPLCSGELSEDLEICPSCGARLID